MHIENKIIEKLNFLQLDNMESCYISNSIVKEIDFMSYESNIEIVIENSIIYDFSIHSCWFRKGLIFKNNHVENFIDYQMGGHNLKPIVISGNIFRDFFNFFDCTFIDDLVLENNIFFKGSNLLGNIHEGFKNTFDKDLIYNNNIGSLSIDGTGIEEEF